MMNIAINRPLLVGLTLIVLSAPASAMAWGSLWAAPKAKTTVPAQAVAWNPTSAVTTTRATATAAKNFVTQIPPLLSDADGVSPTKPHTISELYWQNSISESFWKSKSFW